MLPAQNALPTIAIAAKNDMDQPHCLHYQSAPGLGFQRKFPPAPLELPPVLTRPACPSLRPTVRCVGRPSFFRHASCRRTATFGESSRPTRISVELLFTLPFEFERLGIDSNVWRGVRHEADFHRFHELLVCAFEEQRSLAQQRAMSRPRFFNDPPKGKCAVKPTIWDGQLRPRTEKRATE